MQSSSPTPTVTTIDFRSAAFREEPAPLLAALRRDDPVHRHPGGMWLLTRHTDVVALNRDPRCSRDLRHRPEYSTLRPFIADSPLEAAVERWMLMLDPPRHTAIRQAVARGFTPRAVDGMDATVRRVVDRRLDRVAALAADGPVDLMETFARPFPIQVITAVLGMTDAQADVVHRHTAQLASVVEPAATAAMRNAANEAVITLTAELTEVLDGPVAGGSVIATLRAGLADHGFDTADLVANIMLLFVAGHETTTNLLGNGLAALLDDPEQLALLRAHRELIDRAVEELLRFDPPANVNGRVALVPLEIGGQQIEQGDLLYAMLGAANRDPEVFVDPDRLDITRDPNPHVSFGGGIHFCLGAALARLEARIALECLLERFGHISLAPGATLRRRELVNLRGLEALPLVLRR